MYALLLARDADERAVLSVVLQRAGLAVTSANDLERAMKTWSERPVDLIVLAGNKLDRLEQISRIRAVTSAPVLMIADVLDERSHYALLEAGIDQIISRPYSARLLIAQVRALLRRAGGVPLFSLPTLVISDLTLDPATRSVQVNKQPPRRLTHLEFRLLYTLMLHRGQVLPADTIVEQVWGYSGRGDRELVRGLVRRLRSKVEPKPREPQYILTVSGVGYSFVSDIVPPQKRIAQ